MAELIAIFSDGSDQAALVGLFQASSHLFSAPEATTVVAVGIMKRALEGVGIHGSDSMGCGWELSFADARTDQTKKKPRSLWTGVQRPSGGLSVASRGEIGIRLHAVFTDVEAINFLFFSHADAAEQGANHAPGDPAGHQSPDGISTCTECLDSQL